MVITVHVLTALFKQMGPIYVLTCEPLRKFCHEPRCDIILAPGLNPLALFPNSPDIKALVSVLFYILLSMKQNPPDTNFNGKCIFVAFLYVTMPDLTPDVTFFIPADSHALPLLMMLCGFEHYARHTRFFFFFFGLSSHSKDLL